MKNNTLLRTHIRHLIRVQPDADELINPNIAEHMANSLTDFVELAIKKFVVGQREHGGDIRTKNLNVELYKEMLDMFWYREAQYWNDANIAGTEAIHNPERKPSI
jgi:hypothetical protein